MNQPHCSVCPYHYLKYIVNKVDLLLCPYNFVLDPLVRESMGLNLTDTIVIFDEAHNVETVAEAACSKELDLEDLLYVKNLAKGDQ